MALFQKKSKKVKNAGFTIIELIIVTLIIGLITAVIMANYPKFGSQLSLGRITREMALTIRQAQVYGLAVREFPLGSTDQLRQFPAHGIHFGSDDPADLATSQKQYVLFADRTDCAPGQTCRVDLYDKGNGCGSTQTECLEDYTLTGKEYIKDFCVYTASQNPEDETTIGTCRSNSGLTSLDILFRRPDPEAIIHGSDGQYYNAARIVLSSERFPEVIKVVRIWVTGQISIGNK